MSKKEAKCESNKNVQENTKTINEKEAMALVVDGTTEGDAEDGLIAYAKT